MEKKNQKSREIYSNENSQLVFAQQVIELEQELSVNKYVAVPRKQLI